MMQPAIDSTQYRSSMATAQILEWTFSGAFWSKQTTARIAIKRWALCWITRLRRPFELEQKSEAVLEKIDCMHKLAKKLVQQFDHQEARDKFLEQMQRALERRKNGQVG